MVAGLFLSPLANLAAPGAERTQTRRAAVLTLEMTTASLTRFQAFAGSSVICPPGQGSIRLKVDSQPAISEGFRVFFATVTLRRRSTISTLYQEQGAAVLRRARQITGSQDEAEDVLQEIFRKLVEKPETLDGVRNPTAWLCGATTHLCLNRIRDRKNRARLLEERVTPATPRSEPGSAELLALLRQALALIPDELSEVVVYYYLDQMTHAEIARVVGCSRRQVGNLLERAHAALEPHVAETKEVLP